METRSRSRKIVLGVIYWLAVLAVSIVVLIGLILLLESRDKSSLSGGVATAAAATSLFR